MTDKEIDHYKYASDEPMFEHDCRGCAYLGRHEENDLYVHWSDNLLERTVIARYGSEGPEYISGIHAAHLHPVLMEAVVRACGRGIIPGDMQYPWDLRKRFRVYKFMPEDSIAVTLFLEDLSTNLRKLCGKTLTEHRMMSAKTMFMDKWYKWYSMQYVIEKPPEFEFVSEGQDRSCGRVMLELKNPALNFNAGDGIIENINDRSFLRELMP